MTCLQTFFDDHENTNDISANTHTKVTLKSIFDSDIVRIIKRLRDHISRDPEFYRDYIDPDILYKISGDLLVSYAATTVANPHNLIVITNGDIVLDMNFLIIRKIMNSLPYRASFKSSMEFVRPVMQSTQKILTFEKLDINIEAKSDWRFDAWMFTKQEIELMEKSYYINQIAKVSSALNRIDQADHAELIAEGRPLMNILAHELLSEAKMQEYDLEKFQNWIRKTNLRVRSASSRLPQIIVNPAKKSLDDWDTLSLNDKAQVLADFLGDGATDRVKQYALIPQDARYFSVNDWNSFRHETRQDVATKFKINLDYLADEFSTLTHLAKLMTFEYWSEFTPQRREVILKSSSTDERIKLLEQFQLLHPANHKVTRSVWHNLMPSRRHELMANSGVDMIREVAQQFKSIPPNNIYFNRDDWSLFDESRRKKAFELAGLKYNPDLDPTRQFFAIEWDRRYIILEDWMTMTASRRYAYILTKSYDFRQELNRQYSQVSDENLFFLFGDWLSFSSTTRKSILRKSDFQRYYNMIHSPDFTLLQYRSLKITDFKVLGPQRRLDYMLKSGIDINPHIERQYQLFCSIKHDTLEQWRQLPPQMRDIIAKSYGVFNQLAIKEQYRILPLDVKPDERKWNLMSLAEREKIMFDNRVAIQNEFNIDVQKFSDDQYAVVPRKETLSAWKAYSEDVRNNKLSTYRLDLNNIIQDQFNEIPELSRAFHRYDWDSLETMRRFELIEEQEPPHLVAGRKYYFIPEDKRTFTLEEWLDFEPSKQELIFPDSEDRLQDLIIYQYNHMPEDNKIINLEDWKGFSDERRQRLLEISKLDHTKSSSLNFNKSKFSNRVYSKLPKEAKMMTVEQWMELGSERQGELVAKSGAKVMLDIKNQFKLLPPTARYTADHFALFSDSRRKQIILDAFTDVSAELKKLREELEAIRNSIDPVDDWLETVIETQSKIQQRTNIDNSYKSRIFDIILSAPLRYSSRQWKKLSPDKRQKIITITGANSVRDSKIQFDMIPVGQKTFPLEFWQNMSPIRRNRILRASLGDRPLSIEKQYEQIPILNKQYELNDWLHIPASTRHKFLEESGANVDDFLQGQYQRVILNDRMYTLDEWTSFDSRTRDAILDMHPLDSDLFLAYQYKTFRVKPAGMSLSIWKTLSQDERDSIMYPEPDNLDDLPVDQYVLSPRDRQIFSCEKLLKFSTIARQRYISQLIATKAITPLEFYNVLRDDDKHFLINDFTRIGPVERAKIFLKLGYGDKLIFSGHYETVIVDRKRLTKDNWKSYSARKQALILQQSGSDISPLLGSAGDTPYISYPIPHVGVPDMSLQGLISDRSSDKGYVFFKTETRMELGFLVEGYHGCRISPQGIIDIASPGLKIEFKHAPDDNLSPEKRSMAVKQAYEYQMGLRTQNQHIVRVSLESTKLIMRSGDYVYSTSFEYPQTTSTMTDQVPGTSGSVSLPEHFNLAGPSTSSFFDDPSSSNYCAMD